ncbi:ATP-dependent helicase [Elusimicrobiota bacterium]
MVKKKTDFTREQKCAIFSEDGEFVVKAGAGTGKTRVLVNRYINIFSQNVKNGKTPEEACRSILTVTFTRRAAKEMRNRLIREIPEEVVRAANISTIDAFCSNFLRENAYYISLDSDFSVIDEIESKLLFIKIGTQVLEKEVDWPLPVDTNREVFLNDTYKVVNGLKQQLYSADEFYNHRKDNEEIHRAMYLLFRRYEEHLEKENKMDFGKLLYTAYKMIEDFPQVRENIQDKFRYILVDEYQDTNPAQVKLLRLIASPQDNFFVVGDEQQSIYGFRGAEPKNIVDLFSELPNPRKVVLQKNFRSPEPIPMLVNKIFSDKIKDYHEITSEVEGKAEIEVFLGSERKREAEYTAGKVRAFLDSGYKPEDIVILFRGVKNCQEYEDALRSLNIDTITVGGMGFYQQPEIKDIISILSVIDNPYSERELVRVLRSPAFGLKDSEIAELKYAGEDDDPMYNAVVNSISPRVKKVREFIEYFKMNRNTTTLVNLVDEIIDKSGLLYRAVSRTGGRHSRQMSNLKKFIQRARLFESRNIFTTLSDFVDYLRQLEDAEIVEPEAAPRIKNVIYLMSIHQSKGLEFPVVFISNMSRANFPAPMRTNKYHFNEKHALIVKDKQKDSPYIKLLEPELIQRHNQEERRLLYVAMTRAKEHLVITGHKNKKDQISKYMEYFLEKDKDEYRLKKKLKEIVKYSSIITDNEVNKKNEKIKKASVSEKMKSIKRAVAGIGAVPSGMSKEVVSEFAVTQIETYAHCPCLYNLRYRLKIPESPAEKKFSARLFGSAVHRMLEEYYILSNMDSSMKMKEKIASLIISSGVDSKDYKDIYAGSAEETVNAILKSSILKPKSEIIFMEKPFVLKTENAVIKGTIDRVDKYGSGAELIDYKTSGSEDTRHYELQMGIYNLALNEIFKTKVEKVSIFLVRLGKQVGIIPPGHIKLKLKSLINGIQNEIFPPNFTSGCKLCPYYKFCNRKKPEKICY